MSSKWLNNDFIDSVFSAEDKEIIATTEVDNSLASTGDAKNEYVCRNTKDKIFLLSVSEAKSQYSTDIARIKKLTDYAICNGAYNSKNAGNVWWWLRSPRDGSSHGARDVNSDGDVDYDYVNGTLSGVSPALVISLA